MEKIRGFEFVKRVENVKDKKLPMRSTKNSAGYDFFCVEDVEIPVSIEKVIYEKENSFGPPKIEVHPTLVRTGVKAYMQENEVLYLFNRSSNPVKRGLVLANSVGVVDSDYYNNPDNEGEIGFMFYNFSGETVVLKKGDKIGQGLFSVYLKVDEEGSVFNIRKGGIGSTGE